MLAITSCEQRHNGGVITSKIGFRSSAATTRARARRPAESATLRIVDEGPRKRMSGMGRGLKEINSKLSSPLADEFMPTPPCLSLFVRHVALLPNLTREAPETWSSRFLSHSGTCVRVHRVGKLKGHSGVSSRPYRLRSRQYSIPPMALILSP